MKKKERNKFRINWFEQISEFYKLIFNGKTAIHTNHVSLYIFLMNQNNRCNWSEWVQISKDILMTGSIIHSSGTLYRTIHELQDMGLIEYQSGFNKYTSAKFKIIPLSKTTPLNVPLSTSVKGTLSQPLYVLLTDTLPTLLPDPIYRQVTEKLIKSLSSNIETFKNFNFIIQIRKY